MDLDNIRDIAKIDKENMLDFLVSFPKQCEDALAIAERTCIKNSYKKDYSNIVFIGLGGSAIGGDIIRGYVEDEIGIPIFVNRDYALPNFVNRNSLVFAISYSGNTEETLASYRQAKKRHLKVIVITSGGKLKAEALKNKDTLIIIPKGFPPRCALGYCFIPAIAMLSKLGIIKNKSSEIKEAICFLENLQREKIGFHAKEKKNISKQIAKNIYNKFPIVYAANRHLQGVVVRWKGQFAENSKVLSSGHVFPEMNHNEIVGWTHPRKILKNFIAIFLKDKADYNRVKKRMRLTSSILKMEKFETLEVESRGSGLLERMLSLVYIGDFASFYLSILNGVNPTPVDRITYLKKQLAK